MEEGGDLSNPITARAVKDQYFFKPAYESYRDNFKAIYDAGVTVLAGTDMVLYDAPPLPLNQELAYMVEYGITPLQAIQTATMNPAKVLGREQEFGGISEGMYADLAIVAPDEEYEICPEEFFSKGKNTPFGGKKVSGRVYQTICAGKLTYDRNKK